MKLKGQWLFQAIALPGGDVAVVCRRPDGSKATPAEAAECLRMMARHAVSGERASELAEHARGLREFADAVEAGQVEIVDRLPRGARKIG